jgi:hypothetical protein
LLYTLTLMVYHDQISINYFQRHWRQLLHALRQSCQSLRHCGTSQYRLRLGRKKARRRSQNPTPFTAYPCEEQTQQLLPHWPIQWSDRIQFLQT